MFHAAKGACRHLIGTDDPLEGLHEQHAFHAVRDGVGVGRAQPDEEAVLGHEEEAEKPRAHNAAHHAQGEDALAAVVLAHGEVLARKRHGCRGEGRRHEIAGELVVELSRRTRHGGLAEAVDARLDDEVGKREHGALQAGRHAHLENVGQLLARGLEPRELEAERAFFPKQAHDDEACRQCVGDERCEGDAGDAHAQHAHDEKIEPYVEDAAHGQAPKGTARVSLAAKYGAAEVVQHDKRHAEEVNVQVGEGVGHG